MDTDDPQAKAFALPSTPGTIQTRFSSSTKPSPHTHALASQSVENLGLTIASGTKSRTR